MVLEKQGERFIIKERLNLISFSIEELEAQKAKIQALIDEAKSL